MEQKMLKNYWIWFLLLINIFVGQGQTQIKGEIIEAGGIAIPNAMVVLYDEGNNKMMEYTQSNQEGMFSSAKTYDLGIYRLEISKLGYQKWSQQIIIGTESKKSIDLKVVLHSKSTEIKELTLTAVRPIIVKQDTVIYDVGHFAETHDETLEEVLAKIKGFKILPNGDIEVEGKLVKKVLIDGREISDFGATIVTKSLSG